MFAVFRFPFRGNIGPACLPVRPVAEWLRGFSFTKRKGTIGNGPKVINRRRVAVWKAKEKGSGKEKVPLDPLKRKGQGKRTRRGFLRNLFQDRARAREAKASVRVFFLRGGRGGGSSLRGSAFSPVRGFDLPCTGVSLPLYGQDDFPFMGVEGKQTNENRKEKQDEGKVHNGEGRQQGPL